MPPIPISVGPPPPATPVGAQTQMTTVHIARSEFVAEGSLDDVSDDTITRFKEFLSRFLGVPVSTINVVVLAASVIFQFEVHYSNATAATDAVTQLSPQMESATAATSFLSSVGITVTSTPILVQTAANVSVVVEDVPSDSTPWGAIIGGGAGLAVVVITLIVLVGVLGRRGLGEAKVFPMTDDATKGYGDNAAISTSTT